MEVEKKYPDLLIACIGGGSNAMGLFYDFLDDQDVKMIAVEAAGLGLKTDKKEKLDDHYTDIMTQVKKYFIPEFLNRIDEIIVFNSLQMKDLQTIIDIQ